MENWTSPDDSLTWHLHVPAGLEGQFQVSLLAASHFKMASAYSGGSSPVTVELLVMAPVLLPAQEGEADNQADNQTDNQALPRHAADGGKEGRDSAGGGGGPHLARGSEGTSRREKVARVEMQVAYVDEGVMVQFQRLSAPRPLALPHGRCDLVLRAVAPPEEGEMNLQLLSVELAHTSTLEALAREKALLQADTLWLQEADYGIV